MALQMARERLHPPAGGRVDLGGAFGRDHRVGSADRKGEMFAPMEDKIYRHPTLYELPDEVKHM